MDAPAPRATREHARARRRGRRSTLIYELDDPQEDIAREQGMTADEWKKRREIKLEYDWQFCEAVHDPSKVLDARGVRRVASARRRTRPRSRSSASGP